MNPEDELELIALAEANQARYEKLAKAGGQVQGAEGHYIIMLLEHLLASAPIDLLGPAKLAHERWMAGQLSRAEETFASWQAAREDQARKVREEAIRRGASPPPEGAPTVRDYDLLRRMADHGDPKLGKK